MFARPKMGAQRGRSSAVDTLPSARPRWTGTPMPSFQRGRASCPACLGLHFAGHEGQRTALQPELGV